MRAFLASPPGLSRAMTRIAAALTAAAPSNVEVVEDIDAADVILLHTIGYPETVNALDRFADRKVVIAQYCFRSTQEPTVQMWGPLWDRAHLVWSYYPDLEEQYNDWSAAYLRRARFLITPLGADPIFHKADYEATDRPFNITTSGYVAESETVREASQAVKRVTGLMFHLGPNLFEGKHFQAELGISDPVLMKRYMQSQFVAGLRRCEGFEMPAAEGLLCGARPIMFDKPHYRRWFDGFAEFIPEGGAAEVTDALEQLFRRGARPVTADEIQRARELFNWVHIGKSFWGAVLA